MKRPKSPDLTVINELKVDKSKLINADEEMDKKIKQVEYKSELIQGNQEIIETRIMNIFRNAE